MPLHPRCRRVEPTRAGQPSQVGGQDGLGDRRRHPPAGLLARPRLALHDHRDRDRGRLARRAGEADDPGVRPGRLGAELGGAGLAAHVEAGHVEACGRSRCRPRRASPRRIRSARGLVHRRRPHLGLVGVDDVAVGVADVAEHVGRHHLAAVGHGRRDQRHLQRGGRHVVLADGRLGERRQVLLEVGREVGAGRIGQVDRHVLVEAEVLGHLDHRIGPGVHAHLGERGVARHAEDLEERPAARRCRRSCGSVGSCRAACSCWSPGRRARRRSPRRWRMPAVPVTTLNVEPGKKRSW